LEPIYSCEVVWDLLSAYADDAATPDQAYTVERHIAVCAECARDLQFMRETSHLLAQTPDVAPPPGLKDAILAATVYRPTPLQRVQSALQGLLPRASARSLGLAGAAAAAVAAIIISAPRVPDSATLTMPSSTTADSKVERALRDIAQHNDATAADQGKSANATVRPIGGDGSGPETATSPNTTKQAATPHDVGSMAKGSLRGSGLKPGAIPNASTSMAKMQPRSAPAVALNPPRSGIKPRTLEANPRIVEPGTTPEVAADKPMTDKVDVASMPPSGNNTTTSEKDATTEPSHAASASGGTTRLALAVGGSGSPAAADVYSLASLRASLRKQNEQPRVINVDFGMNDRQQMLGVYRSRF
jgi:hypothetical protein